MKRTTVSKSLIEETWDSLAGRRREIVESFYEHLFDQHPKYREMFPDSLDHQMEKMVEMLSAVARFSDHIDLIRPYLLRIAEAHKELGIDAEDVANFRNAMIETLAEKSGPDWNQAHTEAFAAAFDNTIIPLFEEGLDY